MLPRYIVWSEWNRWCSRCDIVTLEGVTGERDEGRFDFRTLARVKVGIS